MELEGWKDYIGTTIIDQSSDGNVYYYTSNYNDKHMYRVEQVLNHQQINIEKYLFGIGPCFPRVVKSFSVRRNELPDFIKFDMKKRSTDNFQVSEMERFHQNEKKHLVKDQNMFKRYTFIMFWSYWAANSQFGFRHGNITLENIALKTIRNPLKLIFNEQYYVTITSGNIPLFINYKRSTLLATRYRSNTRQSRDDMTFLPPELLLNIGNFIYEEDGHDVWSLAITLLSFYFEKCILVHVGIQYNKNKDLKQLINRFPKYTSWQVWLLLQVCFLQKGIGNELFPLKTFLPIDLIQDIKEFDEMYKISNEYNDIFNEVVPESIQQHFQYWLSWNPQVRTNYGELIEDVLTLVDKQEFNSYKGHEIKRYTTLEDDMKRKLFSYSDDFDFKEQQIFMLNMTKYIKTSICDECGVENKNLSICTCCSKLLCGIKCHE